MTTNPTYLKTATLRKRSRNRELRTACAPWTVRHLAKTFGMPIATAILTAEAAGFNVSGERGR